MPKPEESLLIESFGCSAFDIMSVLDEDASAGDVAGCSRKGANHRFGTLLDEDVHLVIYGVQEIQKKRLPIKLSSGSDPEADCDRHQVRGECGVVHVDSNPDEQNSF